MTHTGEPADRPGFRGVRNTDTTAARTASILARQRAAHDRRLKAAVELLEANGYTVTAPDGIL